MATDEFKLHSNISQQDIASENSSEIDFFRKDFYPWIISSPSLVFMISCICANVIIFVFVFVSRTYKSPANYLLANLCLGSVLYISNFIIYNFEKAYHLWSYGPWTCILDSYCHRVPLPLMTLAIMTLSVDRCRIARDPLNMPSKASVTLQIFLVWFISAVLSIPRGLSSEHAPRSIGTLKCRKIPFLNLRAAQACSASLNLLIIYVVPAAILINELRKTRRQMKYLATCQIEQGKSFARRLRLMRNACIFTCIFVTLWLPLGILQFPFDWMQPESISIEPFVMMRDAFGSMVLIQACINPILLLLLSFDFQELVTSCVVKFYSSII